MAQLLYDAAQVRELDRIAIRSFGIDSYDLMCRAGAALFEFVQLRWTAARKVLIVCGAGNNGGDGYVLARLLLQSGYTVSVFSTVSIKTLRLDAKRACSDFLALPQAKVLSDILPKPSRFDLIVDAILGSGIDRIVSGELSQIFTLLNKIQIPILAVDIPSGLSASSGAIMGEAVRADATVTFIGHKRGLLTQDGPDCTGEIFLDRLEIPSKVFKQVPCQTELLLENDLIKLLPKRHRNSHKGSFGSVLVIGGNHGMGGAISLAAHAALRSGAGLVKLASRTNQCSTRDLPDVIRINASKLELLDDEWDRADVIAIGPGLGVDDWALKLFNRALASSKPKVLDADALNLLADYPAKLGRKCVITPHPKEAARLLNVELSEILSDRFVSVHALAERYQCHVVLKGCGSLITNGNKIGVCDKGNPGMAVAGMGDVLTGIIAALMGQGLAPYGAARLGVYWHAVAGDAGYDTQGIGLLATDVVDSLKEAIRMMR